MSNGQQQITPVPCATPDAGTSFKPLWVIAVTLTFLLAISLWIQWYSRTVSLPRYCDDPAGTLVLLERVLTEARPAGSETRRPYLVAAKLVFLVPRESNEDLGDYLARVRHHIAEVCR